MGSFYAELHVAGHAFPVRRADFSVHQDTDHRGRVIGKVRHGPLYVTMDVPREVAVLEAWAAAPYKPLPGQLVFYDATAQIPQETIGFAAGHCTHYGEAFDNGRNGGSAAYVCRLTISAEVFELLAGGVSARAFPAAQAVAAVLSKAVKSPAGPPPPPTDAEIARAVAAADAARAAQIAAALAKPEYSLAEFAATIRGAEHMQPQEVIAKLYELYHVASAASVPGKPSIPDWKEVETLMRSSYYTDPENGKRMPLNGHWPPANGGFQRQTVQLKEGDVFDRFQGSVVDQKPDPADPTKKVPLAAGDEFDVTFIGEFTSLMGQAGTPKAAQLFESRALDRAKEEYPFAYTIEILQDVPLDVVRGEFAQVIPWYDQPGGGTQTRLEFLEKDWKWQEWKKMQASNYAKITLNSSPSGKYAVLQNNRAKKLT